MTRLLLAITCCAALAACGVDGEPEAPEPQPTSTTPPPQVSGAVTISNNGVYPSIGVSQGWWSVYVGRGWWY